MCKGEVVYSSVMEASVRPVQVFRGYGKRLLFLGGGAEGFGSLENRHLMIFYGARCGAVG